MRLFHSRSAGLLTAAVFSADGFLIAYSRAALLDGYLAACAIAALLLASFPWSVVTALLGGVLAGVASNLKFSGIGVFVPLVVSGVLSTKSWPRRLLLGALLCGTSLVVYTALYRYGLTFSRATVATSDVWTDTAHLFAHHSALTQMANPWTSGWSTWFLPVRPLLLGFTQQAGTVRVLTTLGNLAFWWSAVALTLASGWVILMRGLRAVLAAPAGPSDQGVTPGAYVAAHGRAVVLVLCGALAFLAPWVLTHRDSYIYHFLPSYACMLMLLAGYLAWALQRRPTGVLLFMLVSSIVLVLYAPLWSFMPISMDGVLAATLSHELALSSCPRRGEHRPYEETRNLPLVARPVLLAGSGERMRRALATSTAQHLCAARRRRCLTPRRGRTAAPGAGRAVRCRRRRHQLRRAVRSRARAGAGRPAALVRSRHRSTTATLTRRARSTTICARSALRPSSHDPVAPHIAELAIHAIGGLQGSVAGYNAKVRPALERALADAKLSAPARNGAGTLLMQLAYQRGDRDGAQRIAAGIGCITTFRAAGPFGPRDLLGFDSDKSVQPGKPLADQYDLGPNRGLQKTRDLGARGCSVNLGGGPIAEGGTSYAQSYIDVARAGDYVMRFESPNSSELGSTDARSRASTAARSSSPTSCFCRCR